MAWWQEIIKNYRARQGNFSKADPSHVRHKKARPKTGRAKKGRALNPSAGLTRFTNKYLYNNYVDLLYVSLSVFTYLYVILSALTFAFQENGPYLLAYSLDALSEPYLGALAIYVLVKEIERRNLSKEDCKKRRGELFVIIWLSFLFAATAITYFSDVYNLNEIYQTIVTNSLAAIIIRIGSLLR